MTEREKVTVEEVIGLIHTDETTDSVEEVRKLRGRENMTEKRFTYDKPMVAFAKAGLNDNLTGKTYEFTVDEILDLLNELHEENQQIKTTIKEAYRNERTHIGESVLRQLINQIWSE